MMMKLIDTCLKDGVASFLEYFNKNYFPHLQDAFFNGIFGCSVKRNRNRLL